MTRLIDITGQRFGRLLATNFSHKKGVIAYWHCLCDCGKIRIVSRNALVYGRTKSCRCLLKERRPNRQIHGLGKTRLYYIWRGMKSRCTKPTNSRYYCYGAKGVKIYTSWYDFKTFYEWAIANGYADDLTIDRIDNDGNYEPSNCRWADNKTQMRNRTNTRYLSLNGIRKPLVEWCEILGVTRETLYNRIKRGLSENETLSFHKHERKKV